MKKEIKLKNLGFSSHIRGFNYILIACDYIKNINPYKMSVTKEVYKYIAKKDGVTEIQVERCIRFAIEKAYTFGRLKEYYNKRPTNKQFLIDFVKNYI